MGALQGPRGHLASGLTTANSVGVGRGLWLLSPCVSAEGRAGHRACPTLPATGMSSFFEGHSLWLNWVLRLVRGSGRARLVPVC